jgi:hypothetical protein
LSVAGDGLPSHCVRDRVAADDDRECHQPGDEGKPPAPAGPIDVDVPLTVAGRWGDLVAAAKEVAGPAAVRRFA